MANRAAVAAPTRHAEAVDRLIKSFNTWAFKREQPSDMAGIARRAEAAVAAGTPLHFVLYWGKGPRADIAAPEIDCLAYLADMAARIQAAHPPGARIELLLTDTHARLNGHRTETIDSYFAAVADAATAHGFVTRRLSALRGTARMPGDLHVVTRDDVPADLVGSAAKWYRGPGSPLDGAVTYYAMNMVEKVAVERAYPDAIFVTFNNSRLRSLFPDSLPIFYMYSLRKGFAVKPWFIDARPPAEPRTKSGPVQDAAGA